ncbi:MAG: phosphodiester glycosidase family protein [Solobacterium sp.]|nr:phosphodiester glycosidase family protein [Solobacterium sp.]
MAKKKKTGISLAVTILLCLLTALVGGVYTAYALMNEKYGGDHPAYTRELVRSLDRGSFEYKIAEKILGEQAVAAMRQKEAQPAKDEAVKADIPKAAADPDTNGDGVYIEHIYAPTYEGYMMVVKDPSKVYITVNPDMGSGRAAPELEDYVEMNHALAGINGGGFEDSGGTGNGSIPEGLVIQKGQIVHGTAATTSAIVGITKDHKLVTTTTNGASALAMGVYEAVTFGPTFITDGRVTYRPGTDNLNMLNPRTAVGQQKDGTMLLLVIDGRGPSSFGAKYEDVIEVFQKYDAVMAGNLDGGNSSVMIYNGRYIHYPVSMYDSRNLPSVVLVRGDE